MNTYIILIVITIPIIYKVFLACLSYKNTFLPLPDLFQNIIGNTTYQKNLSYNREKIRLSILSGLFEWGCFVALIYYKKIQVIYNLSYSLGFNEATTGTLFFIIILLLFQIIHLPFSYYSTFSIEQRYQLNTCTLSQFCIDFILSLFLSILILSPLLYTVLKLIQSSPHSWLWIWGALTFYQLFLSLIAPIWIAPLFNKFTPLPQSELKKNIDQLCKELKFKVKGVFVIDGSKRSKKANAFFTGFGSSKRIALFDTLIEKCSKEEVLAVLAHEIGHYKHKHILYGILTSIITTGIGLFTLSKILFSQTMSSILPWETTLPLCLKLLIISLFFTPIQIIINMISNGWSRANEFQADFFSIRSYPHPTALIDALKKLSVTNKSCLTPHPLVVFLSHSHPTLLQRQLFLSKKVKF